MIIRPEAHCVNYNMTVFIFDRTVSFTNPLKWGGGFKGQKITGQFANFVPLLAYFREFAKNVWNIEF